MPTGDLTRTAALRAGGQNPWAEMRHCDDEPTAASPPVRTPHRASHPAHMWTDPLLINHPAAGGTKGGESSSRKILGLPPQFPPFPPLPLLYMCTFPY